MNCILLSAFVGKCAELCFMSLTINTHTTSIGYVLFRYVPCEVGTVALYTEWCKSHLVL